MKRLFFLFVTAALFGSISFTTSQSANAQFRAKSKSDTTRVDQEEADDQKADEKEKKADEKEKKIETVAVATQPLTVFETFDGVFESTRVQEIKTDFETWTDLKIDTVADEGSAVSADQELLKFDTESIDKAVIEAEYALANAQFDLQTAQLEAEQINKTFELDQEQAKRDFSNAEEDHEYYKQIELPQQMDDLDFREKTAGYFLEYSKDELDQLEQMYTEDELTEESEEIVLKRARRSVESAQRSKDRTMRNVGRDRAIDVPREQTSKEEALKRAKLAFDKSQIVLPIQKSKVEVALRKAIFNAEKAKLHLTKIQADQKKMTLMSPGDGILYFGKCVRGKWSGAAGASRRLDPGSKVAANKIVMTIVDINQLMIRASIEEEKLDALSPRMRGKALIKAAGKQTVPVMIKSVSLIPLDAGKFDCQVVMENAPAGVTLMPGMTCKMSFQVYENKSAITAPKASVFSDDEGVTHYVYVLEDDKPVRKSVQVGHTSGDLIEIVDGLTDGEKITKAKP